MSDNMMTTVPWYVTFGIGGLYGGQYTEIRVPAHLSRQEQAEKVRMTAFDRYGTSWAFDYPPEAFDRSIGRYGMTLREVVTA